MTRTPVTVRVARWSASHPWKALGLWLAFLATTIGLAAAIPTQEATDLDLGSGRSGEAAEMLHDAGITEPATENVIVTSRSGPLDRNAVNVAMTDLSGAMEALPEVAAVDTPMWSASGDAALVPITITGDSDDAADRVVALQSQTELMAGQHPGLRFEQIGGASLDVAIEKLVEEDLANAESLSLPITLGLMLLAFGALIAASIPVFLALSAVISSLGLYALASHFVPDAGSVANMVLLIGMAVGVDYSLFFVKRQREERERGHSTVDAVEIAARTAGHSIIVAGLAVIVSLAGLFFVGNVIFAGLATGAILVVAVAMLGSLTVVPALVGKLGRWVDRPRVPLLWRVLRRTRPGSFSGRLVAPVLRRPKTALVVSTGLVLLLAAPALTMRLQDSGVEQLPQDLAAVQALERLQSEFPSEGALVSVVANASPATTTNNTLPQALETLRREAVASGHFVDEGDHVTRSGDGNTFELVLHTPYNVGSDDSIAALGVVRNDVAPRMLDNLDGVTWATAGQEAESADFADEQTDALPWVVGFVLVFTLIMMGLTFRSVGVAVITLVLNLASVAAAFGVLVLVFQHGWAESLLGFESNGAVVSWIPLFLFVVLVGLSMDYHVLVLSRIREAAQRGASPLIAISWGVRQTAGPLSMAALVMVSVFGLFATGSLPDMKQMGVGLAAAILIDATLIRIVMLPALLAVRGGVVEAMARRSPAS